MQRLCCVLVPTLALCVAMVQIGRAKLLGQSPWKGGGFGMFASVDSPGARFLKVYLETAEGRVPVRVPDGFKDETGVLRVAPSQARIDSLATDFAALTWVAPRTSAAPSGRNIRALEANERVRKSLRQLEMVLVHVELWRIGYQQSDRTISATRWLTASAGPAIAPPVVAPQEVAPPTVAQPQIAPLSAAPPTVAPPAGEQQKAIDP